MITSRSLRPVVLTAAFLATAGTALAAGPAAIVNNVPTINGGVTKDEADLIRQEAPRYPLEITLARRGETPGRNEFVAEAQLRVLDSGGRVVLERADTGPIFLASLPDGAYTIEVTYAGETKTQRVQLSGGRHAAVTFLWQ
jgi:hypothetical protein